MKLRSCTQFAVITSIATFALLGGGCASIVKGTTQPIPVSSVPTGADVILDGNRIGQTPMTVEVKRKSDHLLTLEKTGYQSESIAITRNMGGDVFGNIIAGGLVDIEAHGVSPLRQVFGNIILGGLGGWGVDAISGAQYNLTPATINIALRVNTTTVAPESATKSNAAIFIEELKKLDDMHATKQISDEEYAKMRASLVEKYSK